ncbi:MAG: VIT domain-containing protein [Bradymonadia bacterium]
MTAMPIIEMEPSIHMPAPSDPRGLGGLMALIEGVERPLPLASVQIRAHIIGGTCRTVVEQRFHNPLETAMEAVHIFPLPEDGAVVEMSLQCGDLVVQAECREKAEAKAIFDNAREVGHRAALLTQERDDVHTLRVTRLPAKEAVTVRLVVVEQLEVADGQYRWRFPTTIAPRYLPGTPISHEGPGVLPDTDQARDASRLQPPLRLAGGTALDLEVSIEGLPKRLASSLHSVRLDLDAGGVKVAPSTKATLNKDFILSFAVGASAAGKDGAHSAAQAWTDGAYTLVQVQPPALADTEGMPRDVVFVVDISGSMGGQKIDAAKAALSAALHGLVIGDRFKLIAFDDRLEHFQSDFVAYDDRTLTAADAWINGLYARGGTEMLPAIKASLEGSTPPGRLRTVLFITDGQAWNEQELVAAVSNRRKEGLFFTLGIDTAVNGALLKRLARVGGGTCELATPGDDVDELITRFEARFGAPLATDVAVAGRPDATLLGGTLFAGRPVHLLIEGAPAELSITAAEGSQGFPMSIVPQKAPEGFSVGALWARRRVAALEDRLTLKPFEEEALRPEIIKVALAHHIASKFTSFVAVERTRVVQGPMTEVVQPAELPESWNEGFFDGAITGSGAGAPAGMPMPSRAAAPAPKGRMRKKSKAMAPPREMAKAEMDCEEMEADLSFSESMAPEPMAEMPAPPSPSMPVQGASMDAMPMAPQQAPGAAPKTRGGGLFGRIFGGLGGGGRSSGGHVTPAPSPAKPFKVQPEPAPTSTPTVGDLAALAKAQGADGSYGGDVARTAAALMALILSGHTRQAGLRRRTVVKAARWLKNHAGTQWVDEVLAYLEEIESGAPLKAAGWMQSLVAAAGIEGEHMQAALGRL